MFRNDNLRIISPSSDMYIAAMQFIKSNFPIEFYVKEKMESSPIILAFVYDNTITAAGAVSVIKGVAEILVVAAKQELICSYQDYYDGPDLDILQFLEDYAWFNNFKEVYISTTEDLGLYLLGSTEYEEVDISFKGNHNCKIKLKKLIQDKYVSNYFSKITLLEFYRYVLQEVPTYTEERLMQLDNKESEYEFASDFADFFVDAYLNDDQPKLKTCVHLVHDLVTHNDHKVSELAVIGILEGIQTRICQKPYYEEFSKILTTETRLCWNSLNKFWNKEIPYVGSDVKLRKD